MFSKVGKIFERIESDNSRLRYWLLAFFAIIFIRNFLEGVMEADHSLVSGNFFFIEFPISYFVLFLTLLIILQFITREKSATISKVLVVLFSLLLVVPVIDFIATSGEGYQLRYLRGDSTYLFGNLATNFSQGGSIGQRIEITAFGLLLLAYIFKKTKSFLKTLAAGAVSYVALVTWAALPSLLYMLSNLFFIDPIGASVYGSSSTFAAKVLDAYITQELVTLLAILIMIVELAVLLAISDKRRFDFFKKLVRPLRLMHYIMLASFGLFLGFYTAGGLGFELHDYLFSLGFLLSVTLMYQSACIVNDIFDRDLYARVKIKRAESHSQELKYLAIFLAILSLLLTYPLGYGVFVFMVTFASLAFIYSAPPLRLKRYPIVASLSLAVSALMVVMAGFAVFAQDAVVEFFPVEIAVVILVVYTLGTNYKDLKDVELDRKSGVYTIPVLLGEAMGKVVISALLVFAFLLVPLMLGISDLWPPSIVAAGKG